jgi:hypothetical protein
MGSIVVVANMVGMEATWSAWLMLGDMDLITYDAMKPIRARAIRPTIA